MPHGLRGFALLIVAASVGCTAPEKIAPQRIGPLPPPQLPPASPTTTTKPANPPVDNRGAAKPTTTTPAPVPDVPMPGMTPPVSPPAVGTPNPATMPLYNGETRGTGRGTTPTIPTPTPPGGSSVNPSVAPTVPKDLTPPDLVPAPAPPPLPSKIEVVPAMPSSK